MIPFTEEIEISDIKIIVKGRLYPGRSGNYQYPDDPAEIEIDEAIVGEIDIFDLLDEETVKEAVYQKMDI